MQTCIGFLITTASIRMIPLLLARVGWEWAFAFLAPGPLLGIVAMMRLKVAAATPAGDAGHPATETRSP